MKKFQFRYESVEKVRKQREQEALRGLASAQEVLRRERERKKRLVGQLNEALSRREGLGKVPVGRVAFQTEEDFIVGLKQRIVQADQAILKASRGVEKALRNYLGARREMRMMEVLREKDLTEYKDKRRKFENRALDDLYTMRFRLVDTNK